MGNFIGKSVKRREDARFLKGAGRFTDDIKLPKMAQAAFVRSPYAHARVVNIDSSKAQEAEGVVARVA